MKKRRIIFLVGLSVSLCFGQGIDLDRNGLWDSWEQTYFGTIGVDAAADFDGDGKNALQEMLAGTDPTNRASRLLLGIASATNQVALTFRPVVDERMYDVDTTSDLSAAWHSLSNGSLIHFGAEASITDSASTQGFYRVSITPSSASYTGTVYYVSTAGNNSHDGRSPATAWQTLDYVRHQPLLPGDAVLLRRGDTWRETFYLIYSGTPDAWITYGAYGTGGKPRILGSESATNWTEVTNQIWQSSGDFTNPYAGGYSFAEVFFEALDGAYLWGRQRTYDASFSQLTQERDWCWNADKIYVYAPTNPDQRYQAVEVPQRSSVLRFPGVDGSVVLAEEYVEYIALDNLELMYAVRHGVYPGYNEVEAHGLRITHCHIGCIGVKGGASAYGIAAWHSDALIQYNEIHDCGRRAISYNTYTDFTPGLTVQNVTISHNYFYHGYHTTATDISSLPNRGHTFSHFTISYNLIDDREIDDFEGETSNGIYVAESGGNTYSHFYIHHNIILGATARAILMRGVDDLFIYHNTIYGSHSTAYPYALVSLDDAARIDFRNNIIHGTLPAASQARCVLDEGTSSFSIRNYNLYFQEDPAQPFTGSQHGVGGWDTFISEWDEWTVASGFDLSSPAPQNPQFIDLNQRNFYLQPGSPAVDAGTLIPGINDDFIGLAPDLGALESRYNSGQVDDEAPTIPADLSATPRSDSVIDLAWSASTDNISVAGYRLYRDGSLIATPAATTYADTNLAEETSYTYTIEAFDSAGNTSALSDEAIATTLVATPSPTLTASSFENEGTEYHPPEHAYDGDLETRWSALGTNEWIAFEFPSEQIFSELRMAFYRGDERTASFDVETSEDGIAWSPLYAGQSSGTHTALESFALPSSTGIWFRVVGHGNTANDWNSYTEMEWIP